MLKGGSGRTTPAAEHLLVGVADHNLSGIADEFSTKSSTATLHGASKGRASVTGRLLGTVLQILLACLIDCNLSEEVETLSLHERCTNLPHDYAARGRAEQVRQFGISSHLVSSYISSVAC
jgi:hypothetical protein